jgi:hypothetical protein
MPRHPHWQDLPPHRQEQLLRLLGQMLAEQLAVAASKREVPHDHF